MVHTIYMGGGRCAPRWVHCSSLGPLDWQHGKRYCQPLCTITELGLLCLQLGLPEATSLGRASHPRDLGILAADWQAVELRIKSCDPWEDPSRLLTQQLEDTAIQDCLWVMQLGDWSCPTAP